MENAVTAESIKETIRKSAVKRKNDGAVLISKRGHLLNWLLDLRPMLLRRDVLTQLATLFWERYRGCSPLQLGGVETTGITLLAAILMMAPADAGDINCFIIRKERKRSGFGNVVEGAITDASIILVDDTINSGSSAEKSRLAIEYLGHKVTGLFTVVDFRSDRGLAWRDEHKIEVTSVVTLDELGLSVAKRAAQHRQRYRPLWRVSVPGGFPAFVVPKSTPLLVDGYIYRGCDAGKMHAFEASSGKIAWEYCATGASSRKGIWSSPAHHGGAIFFGAYNGTIYSLNASDGAPNWTQPCGEWIGASPLVVPRHGLVYFGIEYQRPWAQGSLSAFHIANGNKVWEYQTKKMQHGSPAYWNKGDLIVWGTADHEMVAFDAATGDMRWVFPTQRSVKYAPAISEERGIVGFASYDKSIYILELATGRLLGKWETGEVCYTTPLIAGSRMFCGSGDRHLYVIDLDRLELIERIDLGARVYSSPRLLEDDRVIVGTNGGNVIEFDMHTLRIMGRLQLPDAVTNAIAITPDSRHIFVSTYMNHLYAFERL